MAGDERGGERWELEPQQAPLILTIIRDIITLSLLRILQWLPSTFSVEI